MRYTNSASTGKRISSIGLGCVTFGREIDQAASFAFADRAQELGVTFFDTAVAYGAGASETILGAWQAVRPSSKSVLLATKLLPPFTPEKINEMVEQSMKRLGITVIDLLYLHRWDETYETPESLDTLDRLVRDGKVRALGASNFTAERLAHSLKRQKAKGLTPFTFVQNNHNLAVSDLTKEFRQVCTDNNISIVTYSPLGAGFLTGKHQQGVEAGSRFALIPGHQNVYFHEASYKRLKKLQEVSARTGHSMPHLALAWALHQPGVASVLIGGRTPAHLDQAFAAEKLNDPAIFAELEAT